MPFSKLDQFIKNDVSVNLHYLDRCNQNKTKIIKSNYELILNEQIGLYFCLFLYFLFL